MGGLNDTVLLPEAEQIVEFEFCPPNVGFPVAISATSNKQASNKQSVSFTAEHTYAYMYVGTYGSGSRD